MLVSWYSCLTSEKSNDISFFFSYNNMYHVSPQVVSPSDVQFKLAEDDKDEVVINLNSVPESLCLNTAAFIGVTVTFVMLLIVASIVIVFLWLRIRTLTRKNLL